MHAKSEGSNSIPKMVSFVWLGEVLNAEGRQNIQDWKQVNPDYQMNLWIDSSTFKKEFHDKKDLVGTFVDYPDLIKWAIDNDIHIHDINLKPNHSFVTHFYPNVQSASELHNQMISKAYYEDELSGAYRNLAAASDILRTEVLFTIGGIYFDVMDIFPDKAMGTITPQEGFLWKLKPRMADAYNNDVLASVPKGKIITAFRNHIKEQYDKLYEDKALLQAHRNRHFFLEKNKYSSETLSDSRFETTLNTSGPQALLYICEQLIPGFNPGSSVIFNDATKALAFDPNYYNDEKGHALSWKNASNEKAVLRLKVIRHLDNLLLNTLEQEKAPALKTLYGAFHSYLNILPSENSLITIYNLCKEKISFVEPAPSKELNTLLNEFKTYANYVEHFIDAIPEDANFLLIEDILSGLLEDFNKRAVYFGSIETFDATLFLDFIDDYKSRKTKDMLSLKIETMAYKYLFRYMINEQLKYQINHPITSDEKAFYQSLNDILSCHWLIGNVSLAQCFQIFLRVFKEHDSLSPQCKKDFHNIKQLIERLEVLNEYLKNNPMEKEQAIRIISNFTQISDFRRFYLIENLLLSTKEGVNLEFLDDLIHADEAKFNTIVSEARNLEQIEKEIIKLVNSEINRIKNLDPLVRNKKDIITLEALKRLIQDPGYYQSLIGNQAGEAIKFWLDNHKTFSASNKGAGLFTSSFSEQFIAALESYKDYWLPVDEKITNIVSVENNRGPQ